MLTVRLHSQAGMVWVLFRCCVCSEVQKRPLSDAMVAPPACTRCGTHLEIAQALAQRDEASRATVSQAAAAH